MDKNEFILYGANGYTAQLIARLAKSSRMEPVLAGRRASVIEPLAKSLKLPYRIVSLHEKQKLHDLLSGSAIVLNAAGPFAFTARPMIEACLATGTHYLDITGEMPVFEMAKQYDAEAKKAGILIMPGVGFDVVPTDCLALFLKGHLPDASQLKLAFTTLNGSISHGTAMTMIQHLGEGGATRVNGNIIKVPVGHKSMQVNFGSLNMLVMSIPWGDISTAYHTTNIPDIEVYTGISPHIYRILKFQRLFNWILRTGAVRSAIRNRIDCRPSGPSTTARQNGKSFIWGQVKNRDGKNVEARLTGPEGYTITAHTSVLILKKGLAGDYKPGYFTPAGLFGPDLILEVPDVSRVLIT
ncbi:MAG: saccharopine dehydrogenase NADP-binding domain-containing protein [Chitinophagaceae bacterium]